MEEKPTKKEISQRIKNWEWNLEKLQFKRAPTYLTLDQGQVEEEIKFLRRIRRIIK